MRAFWALVAAVTVGVAAAMAVTLPTTLGAALWHHNAGLGLLLAAAAAAWPRWGTRRFATLVLAGSGLLATATGGVLLYTRDFPYKDWITWWHVWTSFAFLVAFLAHWANNRLRLRGFAGRLLGPDRRWGYPAAAAWIGVLAFGAWTAAPGVRDAFTRQSYLALSSWAVLAGVAFAYGWWLLFRWPTLRARLAEPAPRNRVRALVDASLFLACWLALLTGLALLYFAEPLRAGELKYVSKWWHTAASVALLAFVALHVGFNARLLARHADRIDRELGRRD